MRRFKYGILAISLILMAGAVIGVSMRPDSKANAVESMSLDSMIAQLPKDALPVAPEKLPPVKAQRRFKTGAKPTPRHVLIAAPKFLRHVAAAPAIAYVPSKLSFWLNNQDGDCVTAEEAFAKACSGIYITDATVQTWASQNGVLNGADLNQVLTMMQTAGFKQDGNTYNDGPAVTVDYSNETVLQQALTVGPVKIGIDADALPVTAGNQSGWVATGGSPGSFTSEDHCVCLAGFGTAQFLFSQLQVPLPASLSPTTNGYLLFTWNTIGFVDHAWIMSTTGEAWVRNPTTNVVGTNTPQPDPPLNPPAPVPPTPPVPPGPAPVPPSPTPGPLPIAGNLVMQGTFPDGSSYTSNQVITYTPAPIPIVTVATVNNGNGTFTTNISTAMPGKPAVPTTPTVPVADTSWYARYDEFGRKVWYTKNADGTTTVKQIEDATPLQSFPIQRGYNPYRSLFNRSSSGGNCANGQCQ